MLIQNCGQVLNVTSWQIYCTKFAGNFHIILGMRICPFWLSWVWWETKRYWNYLVCLIGILFSFLFIYYWKTINTRFSYFDIVVYAWPQIMEKEWNNSFKPKCALYCVMCVHPSIFRSNIRLCEILKFFTGSIPSRAGL